MDKPWIKYITMENLPNEDLNIATDKFTSSSKRPKRIFATYTAMLEIRKIFSGKSLI